MKTTRLSPRWSQWRFIFDSPGSVSAGVLEPDVVITGVLACHDRLDKETIWFDERNATAAKKNLSRCEKSAHDRVRVLEMSDVRTWKAVGFKPGVELHFCQPSGTPMRVYTGL